MAGEPATLVDLPGGGRNDKGKVSQSARWWVPNLSQVVTIGDPVLLGLPETSRSWESKEDAGDEHGYFVDILYEGITEDIAKEKHSWEPSFSREPIETHEQIAAIKLAFGGIVDAAGKIKFPEKLSKGTGGSSGVGLSQTAAGEADKNPMFGIKDYLVFGAKFRRSYVKRTVPANIVDKIGKIFKKIPGPYPTPDGRDWIFLPPPMREVGNAIEIDEEYMLSAPGGWPKGIYGLIRI